jgi:long-chain acyl-CoA synthetase
MNVVEMLLGHRHADRPALLRSDQVLTHRALATRVLATAAGLAGVRPGAIVALAGDNGLEWVVAYLAVMACGAAAMPIPPGESDRLVSAALAQPGVSHLLCQRRHLARLAPLAGPLPVLPLEELPQAAPRAPAEVVDPATTLAAVMMTSGSTGDPRGVMVSHRNIAANTAAIITALGLQAEDRMLVVLPFSYCFGLSLLHTHLAAGGSVVLAEGFIFPERALDQAVQQRCTGLAGVPSTFQTLLRRTRFAARDWSALRQVQQAGGRLAPALAAELLALLPATTRLHLMYGATEATARLTAVPPERLPDKLGTIGLPIPGVTLSLVDGDGRPVPDGQPGELLAGGPGITLGYLGDEALTARRFPGGRFATGDLARRDADGFYVIESRRSELIKSHGFRISPHEIEDVLLELPAVSEALVAGVPDEQAGEAVMALVVASGPVTADELTRHCLARLPNHKVPSAFRLCPALPRTESGKPSRLAAARMLAS